ncbi:MAG: type II toxin-antitoxin system VapC family toxin [Alphaproteobacteria bacterium]|nr:type II toxin-antitoxin system VapC family toxin [Alphaproteobacteria bacterium]
MFFLDSNVVVAALNERPRAVAERLDWEAARRTPLLISTIVLFELRYGVARSARPDRNAAKLDLFLRLPLRVVPFDEEDASEAGEIRGHLAGSGTPIGPYDVLIAGQARRRRAALVTANRREFTRVPGLIVIDWSEAR